VSKVKFERNRIARTIIMSPMNYTEEALKRFNMNKCKTIGIPSNVNTKFLRLLDEEFGNVHGALEGILYNAGVGSLMYTLYLLI
jgi:hypothetical protein